MKNKSIFFVGAEKAVYLVPKDFGARGFMEADEIGQDASIVAINVSAEDSSGNCLSISALSPSLLSLSLLQTQGLIKERVLSEAKKDTYLREAFRLHGLDRTVASYCFLDSVRMWTMFNIFQKRYGPEWTRWPKEAAQYPVSGNIDLHDKEDEILLSGFEQYELNEQYRQYVRELKHRGHKVLRVQRLNPPLESAEAWMYQANLESGRWKQDAESENAAVQLILSACRECDGVLLECDETSRFVNQKLLASGIGMLVEKDRNGNYCLINQPGLL